MMRRIHKNLLIVVTATGMPLIASAYEYAPLSPDLPFIDATWGAGGLAALWNAFLQISIVVAAILAVIMLAIGGFKYMMSESVFRVQGAKEQMANAILGLLIVLASILVLGYINPQLVGFGFFGV